MPNCALYCYFFFFFLNDPAPPEISPLPLPAALPILVVTHAMNPPILMDVPQMQEAAKLGAFIEFVGGSLATDRKSTRLNSSHLVISYAVFCLKKKTKENSLSVFTKGQLPAKHHHALL